MGAGSGGAEVEGVAVDALAGVVLQGVAADAVVAILGGDIVEDLTSQSTMQRCGGRGQIRGRTGSEH